MDSGSSLRYHVPESIDMTLVADDFREVLHQIMMQSHRRMKRFHEFKQHPHPPYEDHRLIYLGYLIMILFRLLDEEAVVFEEIKDDIIKAEQRLYLTELIQAYLWVDERTQAMKRSFIAELGQPSLN